MRRRLRAWLNRPRARWRSAGLHETGKGNGLQSCQIADLNFTTCHSEQARNLLSGAVAEIPCRAEGVI